jgi:integrase
MPRPKLPPRIYLRKGRSPGWVIKDGDTDIRTGYGPECREDAPELRVALGEYLTSRVAPPSSPSSPDNMMINDALSYYGKEHAPTTADPARIGFAIQALAPFWGELTVSAIKGATCRRYSAKRGVGVGTVRRELGTLRSALVHCEREGYLTAAPAVWMPERPASKDRWLTRDEAARLLKAAAPHLRRFILIALYTGTRKAPILRLQWSPNTEGGHVDTARGLLYRKSSFARKTKKRQTPVKLPRQLLAHLRRWERLSRQHVVEFRGRPCGSIKRAWATASAGLDATPHTLRHTAITWAMQRGVNLADAAGFFGVSMETLERVYWHHHPDYQQSAVEAMERK